MHGMRVLNSAFVRIVDMVDSKGLVFDSEDLIRLLLVAYNRGYNVVEAALDIYRDVPSKVMINCSEKDLCTNDLQIFEINSSYSDDDLTMALLAACRMKFGFMSNSQGDYCIGPGYGLNYPEDIFMIHDMIFAVGADFEEKFSVSTRAKEFYIGQIEFSNYSWFVKTSIGKTGPGPNYFYFNKSSTFVDSEGELHLGIVSDGDKWYASEVVLTEALGYGEYEFVLAGDLSELDENAVLGLFTYDLSLVDKKDHYHREIDFEISRWGDSSAPNSQFAIQAPKDRMPMKRFELQDPGDLIILMDWREDYVYLVMRDFEGVVIDSMNYSGPSVPEAGDERARINLWLYDGGVPSDAVEVVVKEFSYRK